MMIFDEITKKVFGENEYGFPWIDGGNALSYLVRRYGYTKNGSDDYKQLCHYVIPTHLEEMKISISIASTGASFQPRLDKEADYAVRNAEMIPRADWKYRARAWAEVNDYQVTSVTNKDNFFDYIISCATEPVSPEDKKELRDIIDAFNPLGFDRISASKDENWLADAWFFSYLDQEEPDWKEAREAYQEIEPWPDWRSPETYNGTKLEYYLKEWEKALQELLKPTYVRDVYFNILGEAEDSIEYKEDEDGELVSTNVVEPHSSAGYGVPKQFLENASKFIVLIHEIDELGDFWETADMVINKQYKELANMFLRLAHESGS